LGPALKKKAHSKYTTVQVEEVGALFDAGLTGPQIAAKTGYPLSTVYVLLRRAGKDARLLTRGADVPFVRKWIAEASPEGGVLTEIVGTGPYQFVEYRTEE